MRSPSYALQLAVVGTLTADPRLVAFFAALTPSGPPRFYDTVPAGPNGELTGQFPYGTLGEDQIVEHVRQITDEAYVRVDLWSRPTNPVDYGELKTLEGLVRDALSQPLEVAGFQCPTWRFHGSIPRKEPDGVTRRQMLTMCYLLTPAAPV